MRLWTLHPRYLDAKGLVAAWREALLAQKVLLGRTRGYKHHSQLVRFRAHPQPVHALAAFLAGIADEAQRRGYQFDRAKISRQRLRTQLEETSGQLAYEWKHLRAKLRKRAPAVLRQFAGITVPEPHPLFRIVSGSVRDWERTGVAGAALKRAAKENRNRPRRGRKSKTVSSLPNTDPRRESNTRREKEKATVVRRGGAFRKVPKCSVQFKNLPGSYCLR